jgi:hypothetical protein
MNIFAPLSRACLSSSLRGYPHGYLLVVLFIFMCVPHKVSAVREPHSEGGSGGGSGRLGPKLPLAAYSKQVAGHADTLLMMGSAKLCKPMRDVELSVYLAVFSEGDEGSDESHGVLGSEAQHVLQARAKSKPEVCAEGCLPLVMGRHLLQTSCLSLSL